jgi:hypothetical protein
MWDWLHGVLVNAPFLVGATGVSPRLSTVRVVESLVIACITAIATFGLFVWQALPVIKAELAAIRVEVQELKQVNVEQDRKLYDHEGRITRGSR